MPGGQKEYWSWKKEQNRKKAASRLPQEQAPAGQIFRVEVSVMRDLIVQGYYRSHDGKLSFLELFEIDGMPLNPSESGILIKDKDFLTEVREVIAGIPGGKMRDEKHEYT